MAEGDTRARTLNSGTRDEEIAGGVVKANPTVKDRLPEDGNVGGRVEFYVRANNKDILPEHTARRTTYPFINAR